MTTPMTGLRRAKANDAAAVAALLHAFNTEFDTSTPPADILERRVREHLTSGSLIAVLSGEPPCALALLSPRRSVWYDGPIAILDELYVVPERRNEGIGSALLADVEQRLLEDDFEAIEINVDGNDTAARRFYERHGYANHEAGSDEQLLYYYRELGR